MHEKYYLNQYNTARYENTVYAYVNENHAFIITRTRRLSQHDSMILVDKFPIESGKILRTMCKGGYSYAIDEDGATYVQPERILQTLEGMIQTRKEG